MLKPTIFFAGQDTMTKPKLLLLEAPESKLTFEHNGEQAVCAAIRTHYPKHAQLVVAATLRDTFDVAFIDMKIRDTDREELIKAYPYGDGTMRLFRMGMPFEKILPDVEAADLVGITSNFTRSSAIVADLVRRIRRRFPRKPVVVGGVDATYRHRFYLQAGADLIVLGDLDMTHTQALLALAGGTSLAEAQGVAYQEKSQTVFRPAGRSARYNTPIDDTPLPAYDLVRKDLPLYCEPPEGPLPPDVSSPYAFLFTSKGCNHACTFCSVPQLHGKYRFMSIERIERELRHLKSFGIHTVELMEDNLLSRLDHPGGEASIRAMFALLRTHGFAWEFGNGLEIGRLIDDNGNVREDLLDTLFFRGTSEGRFVGAYRLYVPLETLEESPDLVYSKLRPYEEEKKVLEAIARRGLPMMSIGIMVGKPDDEGDHFRMAEERCLDIRRMVESYGVDAYFSVFINTLLPGTVDYQMFEQCLEYSIDEHPELYQFHAAALKTPTMAPHEVVQRKMQLEKVINGPEAARRWWMTGKYAFHRYPWGKQP